MKYAQSPRKYRKIKCRVNGDTCIVIGNGPSLDNVSNEDLSLFPSFGSNRIYTKFTPTYYVSVNESMTEQSIQDIRSVKSKFKFIDEKIFVKGAVSLRASGEYPFSYNPLECVNQGYTVTYVCLQLAYWMGFTTVLLLGVDHFYAKNVEPNESSIWEGEDPNHFGKGYMKPGEKWDGADLASSEYYYQIAKEAFEKDGRKIYNLTEGTHLNVFERMSMDNLRSVDQQGFDKNIMRKLVDKNNPLIVEIGAHQGEDSQHFRNMYPKGTLVLFEPDPRCLQKIRERDLRATIVEGVVSDSDVPIDFYQSTGNEGIFKGWDGSGSILPPKEHKEIFPQILFNPPFKVSSFTLDGYFKDDNLIDFIWMDVQGAEEKVIMGGLETLKKTRFVYTEFCNTELYETAPRKERIMELLPDFEVYGYYENGGVSGNMLLVNTKLRR